MVAVIVISAFVLVIGFSIGYLVRDLRTLHRGGRSLADAPGEAAGVSAAGMTFIGQNGSH